MKTTSFGVHVPKVLSLRMHCIPSSCEKDSSCKMLLAQCLWPLDWHHHPPVAQARDPQAAGHTAPLGSPRPRPSQTLSYLPPKCFLNLSLLSIPFAWPLLEPHHPFWPLPVSAFTPRPLSPMVHLTRVSCKAHRCERLSLGLGRSFSL